MWEVVLRMLVRTQVTADYAMRGRAMRCSIPCEAGRSVRVSESTPARAGVHAKKKKSSQAPGARSAGTTLTYTGEVALSVVQCEVLL